MNQTTYPSVDDILVIIDKLNETIYNQTKDDTLIIDTDITRIYGGDVILVYFLNDDNPIWSSIDDCREYFEDTDSYEDMEIFLRKKINEQITIISKIKL